MAIDHFVHTCNRIAWGPFERPIRFALESVDTFTPSPKCFEGDFLFGWFLQSLWIDDPEVYEYAKEIYGLPVRLVSIREANQSVQDARLVNWTFSTEQSNGEIRFYDSPGQLFQGPQPDRRWFWFNGQGISYVDWHADYKDDVLALVTAHGTLPPPFLYGRAVLPDQFVARSALFEQGHVRAPIQRFADFECETPL